MSNPLGAIYGNMVHEYFVERVREVSRRRDEMLEAVRTRRDAERLRESVRRRIRRCFGPLPARTPLNAQVTGGFEGRQYSVQNIIYYSRPNYPVTANLYRPKGPGPFPAVLGLCGHSAGGKAEALYQGFCLSLAAMGYVVMIIDPVGQGERRQFIGQRTPDYGPTEEHNLIGYPLSLLGEALCTWRLWDAMRGLDFLLSLPEVDKKRVGVTGNSGGGTMTTWLNAMDDRPTMAAPGCFVTTLLANLENELPADIEQYPPGILAAGVDMADFFIAQAPRPTLLMGQKYDFFDTRGLEKTYRQIKRIYALLGSEEQVELFIGPDCHGFHTANREAMCHFFNKHVGIKAKPRQMPVAEPMERFHAAPKGTVANIPGQRFVYEITTELAQTLARQRRPISGKALVESVSRLLNLPVRIAPPHYRIQRRLVDDSVQPYDAVHCYAVETEERYRHLFAVLQLWEKHDPLKPKGGSQLVPGDREALLYLPHLSSAADVFGGQVPVEHQRLLALDVRGIGRTRALTSGNTEVVSVRSGADHMYAGYAMMLEESYLGRRVHDVLSVLDLLASRGTRSVHLCGRGLGAVLATFAGLLHPVVKRVTLKNALLSFAELTQQPISFWPQSSLAEGVLNHFDLPDCYRALSKKNLRFIEPWTGKMEPWDDAALRKHLAALGLDRRAVSERLQRISV